MRRRALLAASGTTNNPNIPSEPVIDINNYLTIKMLDFGENLISFNGNDCEYCINGDGNWKILKSGEYLSVIGKGKYVSFRAELTPNFLFGIGQFIIPGNCALLGNCNSLLFKDNANNYNTIPAYSYSRLFLDCQYIIEVSKNFLPATTLANNCYSFMFSGCTCLTTAPELPATTLANNCYDGMFYNCTSLTTAPELPATTLANKCYSFMFSGCTCLTTAPELPATTLERYCYSSMFSGCTCLTTAPELPATTLVPQCYMSMFYNCTSLTTAPELPATTLANNCYDGMFYNCNKLNYIKMLATNISASACLHNWVSGVASTGIFVKNPKATWDVVGTDGVPEGWTVKFDG